jgi:hypothetical protein
MDKEKDEETARQDKTRQKEGVEKRKKRRRIEG